MRKFTAIPGKGIFANASPEGTRTFRNKRNENKFIETRVTNDGHTEFRQYMYWDTDRGPVQNYYTSKSNRGRWHRARKEWLNNLLTEDYEEVEV